MTVGALYAELEQRIPRALSCDWDNDGLMCCPDPTAQVKRVLVALDVTGDTVRTAAEGGYDLIVSHHPMIFRPLRALEPGNHVAKRAIELARAGISVMSFHTRLDAVAGGVNDTLAGLLGLQDVTPFGEGIGRVGTLDNALTLCKFAEKVRSVTGAPAVLCGDAGRLAEAARTMSRRRWRRGRIPTSPASLPTITWRTRGRWESICLPPGIFTPRTRSAGRFPECSRQSIPL